MKSIITLLFFLVTSRLLGQFLNIPFEQYGIQLTDALTGGLRNPQFSVIDFNNDGKKDIFIFDRTGSKAVTFLNTGNKNEIKYTHAPQYEAMFPKMSAWALLHDYNGDGLEDLFTLPLNGISGIQVYRTQREGDRLTFREVKQPFFNTLSIDINNGFTNLYHALTDIPAVTDVDNDGDTDVLAFDAEGGRIVWYNNEALEQKFTKDTFIMKAKDICFGKVYESMFSAELFLSKDSLICSNGTIQEGRSSRHSGSTIASFDFQCDGDKDLIIGDIASDNVVFLINGGSIANPWITSQNIQYPPSQKVDFPFFHAPFLIDVDNDGVKDLIVAPNDVDGGYNKNHIWLYLNKGSDCNPNFRLETKNFLINQMLSVGAKSNFTLIDVNNDGLLDILASGNGTYNTNDKVNYIFYYKNEGTKTNPKYKLEDDNYLKISSILPFSSSVTLNAGDLENDGDIDLILCDGNGELVFFENKAGKGSPVSFANGVFPYMNMLAGQQAKPQIYDVDGDGLNDILCGKQNNDIVYFKNNGVKGISASFTASPTVRNFGLVFKGSDFSLWNSSPKIFKDEKGDEFAFIGFEDGRISLYARKKTNNTDSLILLKSNFGNIYTGTKATIEIGDINGDAILDLLIGNFRGGLQIYSTGIKIKMETSATASLDWTNLEITPNPAINIFKINSHKASKYTIYSIEGKQIMGGMYLPDEFIDISQLNSGVYLMKLDALPRLLKFIKL